jgi:hypothetical protein
MVTLTTELGEFSGDDEKEVLKLARKAKTLAKKKALVDDKNKEMAKHKAHENAYWLYDRKARGEPWPRGLGVVYAKSLDDHALQHRMTGDTMCYWGNGCAKFTHYHYKVHAVLEGGSGCHLGVWLDDMDRTKQEFYAVGVYEDQVYLLPVFGIDPTDIKERG